MSCAVGVYERTMANGDKQAYSILLLDCSLKCACYFRSLIGKTIPVGQSPKYPDEFFKIRLKNWNVCQKNKEFSYR